MRITTVPATATSVSVAGVTEAGDLVPQRRRGQDWFFLRMDGGALPPLPPR